jgi:hypothetical protein
MLRCGHDLGVFAMPYGLVVEERNDLPEELVN